MSFSSANQFIKSIALLGVAKGGIGQAEQMAISRYGQDSVPAKILKGWAIGTDDIGGDTRTASRDFLQLVNSKSLIGKISAVKSFRKIPPRIRALIQNELPIAIWTGEGIAITPSHTGFDYVDLSSLKIGTEIILTNELLNGMGADFESGLSRDLTRAVGDLESFSFLDPANAGATNVSPASITYGVTPVSSSGTDAEAIRNDIEALFEAFTGDLENAVLCMHPRTALKLCLMQASLGEHGLTINGGTLFGAAVVTSSSIPFDSNGTIVVLLDPNQIFLVDEGIVITSSDQSTVTVIGEDNQPKMISLWQENLCALQIIRLINWEPAREGSVAWLSNVEW